LFNKELWSEILIHKDMAGSKLPEAGFATIVSEYTIFDHSCLKEEHFARLDMSKVRFPYIPAHTVLNPFTRKLFDSSWNHLESVNGNESVSDASFLHEQLDIAYCFRICRRGRTKDA